MSKGTELTIYTKENRPVNVVINDKQKWIVASPLVTRVFLNALERRVKGTVEDPIREIIINIGPTQQEISRQHYRNRLVTNISKLEIVTQEVARALELAEQSNYPPEMKEELKNRLTNLFYDELRELQPITKTVTSSPAQSEAITQDTAQMTNIILCEGDDELHRRLTPDYLANTVNPYLKAIADIQYILDDIQGRKPRQVIIKTITQNSPVSVSLEGASQAIQTVVEYVVPWKRKHAEAMTRLLLTDKQVEIEGKRAEVLEKRARAAKERVESEKLLAEVEKQRVEVTRMQLENDKLRLELQRAKIELALDILSKIAPNLSEVERVDYLVKLLPSLEMVIFSGIDIALNK